MKRNNLLLGLLLINWTVLFAQLPGFQYGPPIRDSLRCYTPTELKIIALRLINGQECDTLLKIANKVIIYKDTIIVSQQRTITKQETRYITTESLASEYKTQKETAEKALKDEKVKKKWILAGWAGTSILLTILTILALIH